MFQFSERHIEEYQTLGYTVFRGIVPATLIEDLRRQCDLGARLGREADGPNAQRFVPRAIEGIDLQPFRDFLELPDIRESVAKVLPSEVISSTVESMFSVLIEPSEFAYCTQWHRDWRDNVKGLDLARWEVDYKDMDLFNQVNCALYEDSCTWVVPGSHLRLDTDAEIARFPARPIPGPDNRDGLNNSERERVCLEYCQSLPGSQRLLLDAGDYCLYRNSLWHLGNYIPYRKRATLHHGIFTTAFREWFATQPQIASERRLQGIAWENPNAARVAVS